MPNTKSPPNRHPGKERVNPSIVSTDGLLCRFCIGCSLSLNYNGTKLCIIRDIFGPLISLSGRRVFDSQSIRLSETVFFCKNPPPVPTHVSTYDVLLNFRSAKMAGNLIIAQNSDPGICDWLTQWLFTQITSSSSR
jgi:hypothetical protein